MYTRFPPWLRPDVSLSRQSTAAHTIRAIDPIRGVWHASCIATDVIQQVAIQQTRRAISRDLQTELIRKSIHLSIALAPTIATLIGTAVTIMLLGTGTLVYAIAEHERRNGRSIAIISRLTVLASRGRDRDHFVLGPVTLGLGAMMAMMLYPDPAASIAIYALAFGDGIASFAGKLLGRVKLPFTGGKTLEGSLACATAVAIAAYAVYPVPAVVAAAALVATILEAIPTGDADNLILPVGVGMVISFLV
jgi:phytol kinase